MRTGIRLSRLTRIWIFLSWEKVITSSESSSNEVEEQEVKETVEEQKSSKEGRRKRCINNEQMKNRCGDFFFGWGCKKGIHHMLILLPAQLPAISHEMLNSFLCSPRLVTTRVFLLFRASRRFLKKSTRTRTKRRRDIGEDFSETDWIKITVASRRSGAHVNVSLMVSLTTLLTWCMWDYVSLSFSFIWFLCDRSCCWSPPWLLWGIFRIYYCRRFCATAAPSFKLFVSSSESFRAHLTISFRG